MRLERRAHNSGIRLLELAVVTMVIVLGAVLIIPRLLADQVRTSEATAASSLRRLGANEQRYKKERFVDQDLDTIGEFLLLGEISGEIVPRGQTERIKLAPAPAQLSGGGNQGDGCVGVGGYIYRLYLVQAVNEDGSIQAGDDRTLGGNAQTGGPVLTDIDAIDMQEQHFVAYAWPAEPSTGSRAYAIDEKGIVVATDMKSRKYQGRGRLGAANVPAADAAFTGPAFTSELAQGQKGNDGNTWTPAKEPMPGRRGDVSSRGDDP